MLTAQSEIKYLATKEPSSFIPNSLRYNAIYAFKTKIPLDVIFVVGTTYCASSECHHHVVQKEYFIHCFSKTG